MAIETNIGFTDMPLVEPWTLRPNQARVISGSEGVRNSLFRFTRRFFAGTAYNLSELRTSRFVLAEDLEAFDVEDKRIRFILFGEHKFENGAVAETRHEVQRSADAHAASGFLLESLEPEAYASCEVSDARDIAAIVTLLEADQKDAAIVGLS